MTVTEMTAVMDALFINRVQNLPPEALAEVFDRLTWCLDDNGSALDAVRESWLRSDDRARVEIVLAMSESFPFQSAAEMSEVLGQISRKWPDLRERCEDLIVRRADIERVGETEA